MAPESVGKVVLVVDDEMFARLFAVQIFLDQGYTVLEAANAEEGLDVLDRNDDVDLVFTDISMPGPMDGLGLVRHVGAEYPDVALLVTSGHGQPESDLLPEGASFLAKPYTAHALMTAIEQVSARLPQRPRRPALFGLAPTGSAASQMIPVGMLGAPLAEGV